MYIRRLLAIGCVALLMGLTSGCSYKVTGGGWLPSADDGSQKANFGFAANGCEAYLMDKDWTNFKGRFNYHDKTAGVMMLGTPTGVTKCYPGNPVCRYDRNGICKGGYAVQLDYKSTNPKDRGEGQAVACAYDNGEGMNATPDWLGIYIAHDDTGPYAGYSNEGYIEGGNIQKHSCYPSEN